MSYLSGIYFESWFSWLGEGAQKTLGKRRKQTEEKHSKNEEKEERRIQGKSNNNNKRLWFYLLYRKSYFVQKHILKKSSLYNHIYLQSLCVAEYLKRSNDRTKLKI